MTIPTTVIAFEPRTRTPNLEIVNALNPTRLLWFRAFSMPKLGASVLGSNFRGDVIFQRFIQGSRISIRIGTGNRFYCLSLYVRNSNIRLHSKYRQTQIARNFDPNFLKSSTNSIAIIRVTSAKDPKSNCF